MLKELIKLADFLDKQQKQEMSDAVDQMVSNLAADPMNAPNAWNLQNPGDISGEWDMFEELDEPDRPTEEMEPQQMVQQHKPSPEITSAVKEYLNKRNQHPTSIKWHIPGAGPGFNNSEEEGDKPYWLVTSRPNDPAEVPEESEWAFWEVDSTDPHYDSGSDISGQDGARMYGEW